MILQQSVVTASEKRRREQLPTDLTRAVVAGGALAEVPVAAAVAPSEPLPPVAPTEQDALSIALRASHLSAGGAKPSSTELERLLGNNDLVDQFFLERALVAAQPVVRIILRDSAARERGWATGFMVSPRLLLTNCHVFPNRSEAAFALAEANYVLDIAGNPEPSVRFNVRGDLFYAANAELDFSLVAVDELALDGRTRLSSLGYHRLIAEPNKIREGEAMTLIQHPGGERRQYAIRENDLIKILDDFLWYRSDTAPGSSGAPAFNDSFQVVALHHSGAAKRDAAGNYVLKDGRAVVSLEGIDDSEVDWIANEGLRVSVLCAYLRDHLPHSDPYVADLLSAMTAQGDIMSSAMSGRLSPGVAPAPESTGSVAPGVSAAVSPITIPIQLQVSLSLAGAQPVLPVAPARALVETTQPATVVTGEEALKYPVIDRDYSTRTGYDPDFLGARAPLPTVTEASLASKLDDGSPYIPYEHFTIVVNKKRRLPMFTASNVDYSAAKRRPEPGDYRRQALDGLGPNDQEKWLTDARIPAQDQLPDKFYTNDGGSFDKGHVVRRDDMCWGDTRAQIVRANGDTFHVTNCTPQVVGFNRSTSGVDNWGDLEDNIQKQGGHERLSVLAGPILADGDQLFSGRDEIGPVNIRIPKEFWKVVLASSNGSLQAFAFKLQQDLRDVPEEFKVTAEWKPYVITIAALEQLLAGFRFDPAIHAADQAASSGHELASALGIGVHESLGPPCSLAGTPATLPAS